MTMNEFFERHALCSGVDPGVVRRLAEAATTHTHARGSALWRAGDAPRALLFVRHGLVKLTRPAPRGRTSLCGLFGPPSTLGELVLAKGVPYQNSALPATKTVTVLSVPRAVALAALGADSQLALNLFSGFEEKLTELHDKIDVLSAGSVEARLATLLCKLHEKFGDELADGTLRIGVPFSRQELADMVSTSFETVIRVLSRWEREGSVLTDSEGFTLGDWPRLCALSGASPERARTRASFLVDLGS
jgi:CRP/FNR family transcriptional regulator, cyclic AMP receptor protein